MIIISTIRVLQVFTKMQRGGAENMIMNYYRNIDRSKIQFDFIVHRYERGDFDNEIEALGGKIYRFPSISPLNFKKYMNELKQFFEIHKEYTIVHAHLDTLSTFVLKAAKDAGIPVRIAHSHNTNIDFDLKSIFRIMSKSQLNKYCNYRFACGYEAGIWLFGKKYEKKINIIPNAIDVDKYLYNEDKANELRKVLKIEDKYIIGHIGRFVKQKNHKYLIEVFNKVYEKNKNTVLLLVGDGELKKDIIVEVRKRGLTNNVIFLGVIEDVYNILNIFDVMIFPSLYEGLPVVMIEAQINGIPIIASKNISKEVDISKKIEFMDINIDPIHWSNYVINKSNFVRRNNNNNNNNTAINYDIKHSVKILENMYFNYSQFENSTFK